MTEGVMQFLEEYCPVLMGNGVSIGFFLGGISALLGYVVSKVQGMIDL